MNQRIAVAGLSARMMAEAAVRDGFEVLALDLFGDLDTRRAAAAWQAIGEPAQLRIDGPLLLAALKDSQCFAWIAGSGFEAQPDLLAEAATLLPLLGTVPEDAARLRDPACFFGFLRQRQIAHPPWAEALPDGGGPWLLKNARACGGWHIEQAGAGATRPTAHHYFQQELPGQPMSATFVGNGREAVVLGINEMIVRPGGGRPYLFCGVIGPLAVATKLAQEIQRIVGQLTAEFRLRGLCSLDFLSEEGTADCTVLEVNARPPASLVLYPGVMRAHVHACLHAALPQAPGPAGVRGTEIVFARHALRVDAPVALALAARPDTHDLPHAGTHYAAGDPVCSLTAGGAGAAAVRQQLSHAREALLSILETCS